HFNIDVDWRTTPLDRLFDIRVRAAKAAELQRRLGVSVDWQRYSWIELEALRRTLISFEEYRGEPAPPAGPPTAAPARPAPAPAPARPWPGTPTTAASIEGDGLVRPTFKGRPAPRSGHSIDPDGVIRPTFNGRADLPAAVDPDGVIRPTFAVPHRWSAFGGDPDGLIAPTFVPYRRLAAPGDTDDLMDPTRTFEGRTVPARW
ncbi:MAG TPA: hypothetical protein VNR90_03615, partial [Vicinamibacterales bacterium]|nr:hypothetical protein [Vicinamibacterales bacterium]